MCEKCGGCRCFDPPTYFSLKRNRIGYNVRCRSQYTAQILKNKDDSYVSDSEKKRIRLNIKTTFLGKYRISPTEIFNLCEDGKKLPNKEKLIKTCNFLGIEANSYDEIPKSGCNMDNF